MALIPPGVRKARHRQKPTYRPCLEWLEARLALTAIADAGVDQDVDRGSLVTLDGFLSKSQFLRPDGLPAERPVDSYTWTQKSGPDVTGGTGTFSGPAPQFTAPARVTTLEFDLIVFDSDGPGAPDRVVVSILEDHAHALFVSPLGSDT